MKKVKKMSIGILLLGLLFNTSCKKEGCMDAAATNYDSEAKKTNNSCTYEGSQVLWYSQTTSEALSNSGSTSLTYYVDGKIVGSSSVSTYYTSKPTCGENGSITIKKDLSTEKNKTFTYKVIDDFGDEIWSGSLEFKANICTVTELAI